MKEEAVHEYRLVLFGDDSKDHLLRILCESSRKWERHAAYADVHFLLIELQGRNVTLEVSDPGLKHTGGREMAIRSAHMALIVYRENNDSVRTQLLELPALFELRKDPCPIRVICDVDENEKESDLSAVESLSEGYESDMDKEGGMKRRESMEKMTEIDQETLPPPQGDELEGLLGEDCRLMKIRLSEWREGREMIEEMVEEAEKKRKKNRRRLFSLGGKKGSKESREGMERDRDSGKSIEGDEDGKRVTHSRVCTVM